MAAIYTMLFWCALQVTLFLMVALPLYLVILRRDPRVGAAAGASVLGIVILLTGLAASPWPRWSLEWLNRPAASPVAGHVSANRRGVAAASETGEPLDAAPIVTPQEGLQEYLWRLVQPEEAALSSLAIQERGAGSSWMSWLAAILVAGIVGGAVHLAASLISVRRLIQRSRPLDDTGLSAEFAELRRQLGVARAVAVRESTELATPATVGTFGPTILLPATWRNWNAAERRSVLAHELAHIAQHDFAAWVIARAAVAIHFYHPLVRWFASRLQLDQELAADAAAARLLGDRQEYLRSLASLALATPAHRVAGPARTFIPGRSLLVRRVEMLRTAEVAPSRLSRVVRIARAACLSGLLVAAAAAAGVRPLAAPAAETEGTPAAGAPQVADAPRPVEAATNADGYVFSYVPNDFVFLFAMRPNEVSASPHLNSLAELFNEIIRPKFKAESLEQVTAVLPLLRRDEHGAIIPGTGSEFTIFRTQKDADFKPIIEASYGTIRTDEYKGKQLIAGADRNPIGTIEYYSPIAGTLISTPRAQLTTVIDNPKSSEPPASVTQWGAEAKGPFFGVVNFPAVKNIVGQGLLGGPPMQLFQPVVDLADYATISVEDGDPLLLKASFACRNRDDAAQVEQTLQAAIVLFRNMLTAQRAALLNGAAGSNPSPGPSMLPLLDLAGQVLATAKVTANGVKVDVIASVKNPNETLRLALIPQLWASRQAAARNQSMNNLKQLALAALIYENRFGALPPAVVYGKSAYGGLNTSGDQAAPVPRSWRVELLPLLDQEALYKEYRLDQSWDSEANLAVLRKMPALFRSPEDAPTSTNSSYFALTGSDTVFDGNDGTQLEDIEDGTSNTLLFAEAKRAVPWTKPEDIIYDANQPIPNLGGWQADVFLITLCDGSVHPVRNSEWVDKTFLRPWIEKSDGQVPLPLWTPEPAR